MSKHSRPFYVFSGIAGFLAVAVVLSTLVMLLWNALLPELFGLPALGWLQAAGLFVLCRALFGGMSSGFRHGAFDRGGRMRDNLLHGAWHNMTDEQRQHLAEEIHKRHGCDRPRGDFNRSTWFNSRKRDDADTPENAGSKKDE
jgi:hypothetical protein